MPLARTARARALRRSVRLRPATPRDLPTLVDHRLAMWRDIGNRTERQLRAHGPAYLAWARPRLSSGEFEAVVAEVDGRPAGSGAIWWMPEQPRPGLPAGRTPYILSMYTAPEFRGLGIASRVVEALLRLARRRRAARVTLHASEQGRPVYTRLGFERTWEMRLWLRPSPFRSAATGRASSRGRAGSRRSAPARPGRGPRRSRSPRRGRSARTRPS